MTRKEFEELKIGDWFHSKRFECEYLVTHTKEDRHLVERIDKVSNDNSPDFWLFSGFENYDFKFGRYPQSETEQYEQQSTVQKMTVTDALKSGLKVGDKIPIEFLVIEIDSSSHPICIEAKEENIIKWLSPIDNIAFTPQPEHLYKPAHNELCTILTKNGLGTKAIAVHYNGKISAISIDNEGNADCHFKAEQIEKFLPLPPA